MTPTPDELARLRALLARALPHLRHAASCDARLRADWPCRCGVADVEAEAREVLKGENDG